VSRGKSPPFTKAVKDGVPDNSSHQSRGIIRGRQVPFLKFEIGNLKGIGELARPGGWLRSDLAFKAIRPVEIDLEWRENPHPSKKS
jgi:hypothetical protein